MPPPTVVAFNVSYAVPVEDVTDKPPWSTPFLAMILAEPVEEAMSSLPSTALP
ncbi:MAG: hypothetical protein GYA24_04595, partial [Candidatus Lokiarchaeota archaeon]|nr:hypothetical protein [Candidatus Lokiarchaeota archaeon]